MSQAAERHDPHPELWYLLAQTEDGKEMDFGALEEAGLLRRRPSADAPKIAPRPASALRDVTGRRMVYGNPSFRFAEIEEKERLRAKTKNDYEGSLRGGLPHGFGTKIYLTEKRWQGRLLPFGTILSPSTSVISGCLIRYSYYVKEVGLLRKTANPIMLIDGQYTINNLLDISRILQRLELVNGQIAAMIVTVKDDKVFQDIAINAKHSPFLECWKGPIICLQPGAFDGDLFGWPSPETLKACIPDLHDDFRKPWLTDNWWIWNKTSESGLEIAITPVGEHHLDKQGHFPIVPVGQFRANVRWQGVEIYAGEFEDGAKHGKGIFVRANGDKHVGHYHGGLSHGKGCYHWGNGDTWVGSWLHGKQERKGEMRTALMQQMALLLQCNYRIHLAGQELFAFKQKWLETEALKRKIAEEQAEKDSVMEEIKKLRAENRGREADRVLREFEAKEMLKK